MIPRFERSQHILPGCVGAVQKPDIHNAEVFERPPCFNLSDCPERCCLLLTFRIAALISASSKNDCDSFFLIEYSPGYVGANLGLIIRVSDNDQKIGFETLIRFWIGTVVRKQKGGYT